MLTLHHKVHDVERTQEDDRRGRNLSAEEHPLAEVHFLYVGQRTGSRGLTVQHMARVTTDVF